MASNTEAQRARGAADRRLREANREEWEGYMHEEYAKRDLVYKRQLTPEERADRDTQEKKLKAAQRIQAEAEKAGLTVTVEGAAGSVARGLADAAAGRVEEVDITTLKQKPLALEDVDKEPTQGIREVMGQGIGVEKATVEIGTRPIEDSPQA